MVSVARSGIGVTVLNPQKAVYMSLRAVNKKNTEENDRFKENCWHFRCIYFSYFLPVSSHSFPYPFQSSLPVHISWTHGNTMNVDKYDYPLTHALCLHLFNLSLIPSNHHEMFTFLSKCFYKCGLVSYAKKKQLFFLRIRKDQIFSIISSLFSIFFFFFFLLFIKNFLYPNFYTFPFLSENQSFIYCHSISIL